LGFCFLAYENQRSTVLAIDNMIGYPLLGRPLRVDHVLDYKPPVRYHPTEVDEEGYKKRIPYEPTGAEGKGIGVYNVTESQKKLNAIQAGMQKIVADAAAVVGTRGEDEMWARQFESQIKGEPMIKTEVPSDPQSQFETPRESRPLSPR
jgi:RNA-binding motif X-linked protein 2